MDYNIVTLEIADLIIHFDYYDNLISDALGKNSGSSDEQTEIRNKSEEHLEAFFNISEFLDKKKRLRPLNEIKVIITAKLEGMKNKDIHNLIEKLEKDAKKIKKLYVAITKSKKG